jgi:hypothetical protein
MMCYGNSPPAYRLRFRRDAHIGVNSDTAASNSGRKDQRASSPATKAMPVMHRCSHERSAWILAAISACFSERCIARASLRRRIYADHQTERQFVYYSI